MEVAAFWKACRGLPKQATWFSLLSALGSISRDSRFPTEIWEISEQIGFGYGGSGGHLYCKYYQENRPKTP